MTTKEIADILTQALSTVIKGKKREISLFLTVYLAGGHILIEDIPGTGKTTLVKSLAALIERNGEPVQFQRIQCTPDLLPYDITGVDVFNAAEQRFEFMHGPVFADILLADELNRTPPKVQSALLQAMEERQVSIGRETHALNPLLFIAATQNPTETLGTYPLPAAQLDRFAAKISLGYPDEAAELAILQEDPAASELPLLKPLVSESDILASRLEQKKVFIHPALEKAIVQICNKTRLHQELKLGASPRAGLQLAKNIRAYALMQGRSWAEDKDIALFAPYTLAHRCIGAERGINVSAVIAAVTGEVLSTMNKKTDWSKGAE
ncbi:AAA family ATPase [Treponema phagedenis]|uniref:AAA family ATPase n=1 Tax=Treponema phagedenis TaxID=162 RepID=UPI0001F63B03|nr:AAA family ATPase [Treponema phagedenis]EFW38644.1 ATPase family associated with various cellular activities (AAA) [Treponema phagedenis F0421]TYT79707.1 AAA family ATPase [Treponema phagedenis]